MVSRTRPSRLEAVGLGGDGCVASVIAAEIVRHACSDVPVEVEDGGSGEERSEERADACMDVPPAIRDGDVESVLVPLIESREELGAGAVAEDGL